MKDSMRILILLMALMLCLPMLSLEVLANAPPGAEFAEDSNRVILVIPYFFTPGMILTVMSESLVARLFRMDAWERRRIRWTNFFSQILMRMLFLLLGAYLPLKYMGLVVLTEAAVYSGEFMIYRKILKGNSTGKLLTYTATANTVSMILGILMNSLLMI